MIDNHQIAPILARIDMMIARGYLIAVDDGAGIQTMQVGVLDGEVIDQVERFQTYGVSAVPPAGDTDVLINFVQGNRDHPVAVAVNDRGSRPKGLRPGEVVLYNDAECFVSLSAEGDVIVRGARNVAIEGVENIEIKAGENIRIDGGGRIDLNAPGGVYAGLNKLD